MTKGMKWYDWTAITLLLAGGFTWGLIGLFGFNLVEFLSFGLGWLERTVYVLVGFASAFSIWSLYKK